jgi:hypothetical protein
MGWIQLTHDKVKWRAFVKMLMRCPIHGRKIFLDQQVLQENSSQ